MKKLAVIFTGGTIGSKKEQNTIHVETTMSYALIEQYKNSAMIREVQFETKQPLQTLSENMIPADWQKLITCILQLDIQQYEGIIVTHGSDTLPFTSACLSYALGHLPIPIVLTASNYPLDDLRSNGVRNFASAIDFILDQRLPGVFTVFENARGEALVYLGTRLMEALPFTDQYDSTYGIPFGQVKNRQFIRYEHHLNPTVTQLKAPRSNPFPMGVQFSSEILYIKPHPGLNYQFYNFSVNKPKAILHDLYHSGTASTSAEASYSLKKFIEYCNVNGVKVYLAPMKNTAKDLYLSSVQILEAGAIAMENISVVAALVKLMIAYGSFETEPEIERFLNGEPVFFEVHTTE